MLHPETVVQTFAPIEVAREMDNLCKSAFVWVPKGNGIWIIMEVAFLRLCNSQAWLEERIASREYYYAPTKDAISVRGRIS